MIFANSEIVVSGLEVDRQEPVLAVDEMAYASERLHRKLELAQVLVQWPQVQAEAIAPAALQRH